MGFSRVAAILSILYDDILPRLQEKETGILIEVWKNEILCIFGAISQELAIVRTIVFFGIFAEPLLLDTESPQPDVLERSRFERSEWQAKEARCNLAEIRATS